MLEVDQVVKHLPLHTKHQMHVSPMMEYGWGTTVGFSDGKPQLFHQKGPEGRVGRILKRFVDDSGDSSTPHEIHVRPQSTEIPTYLYENFCTI